MSNYLNLFVKNYIGNYAGLPIICWQAIALTLIDAIAGGIIFFLSIYFVTQLHFDIIVASTAISCYGIGTIIGGIVGGKLTDRISPQKISSISLAIRAMTILLLLKLKSPQLIMLDLFFMGIATYGFKTSNSVWMLNHCQHDGKLKLKTLNISRAVMNLGFGLAGIIIGFLPGADFNKIFYSSSIILFSGAIFLSLQENNPIIIKNQPMNETNKQENINKQYLYVILTCVFLIGLIVAQLGSTYPMYIKNSFPQLGIKAVSILFILDTFLIVFFQAPLVNRLNKQNSFFIASLGALSMGLGMLVLSLSFSFSLAILSCVIWTTGEMLFFPMAQLICYEKGAYDKKGNSMGVYQSIYAASTVLGPILGGYMFHFSNGNLIWYLCGILGLLCFIACNLPLISDNFFIGSNG